MPDVFLSYKREDLQVATRLVGALRDEGIGVWWDHDIRAGAPWEATIEKALAEARVVLVLWSRAAVGSDNVRSEARWAREQERLIQLFAEPCNPPLFFGERQGIDLAGWTGDRDDHRFVNLVSEVRERLDGRVEQALGEEKLKGPERVALDPVPTHSQGPKRRRRQHVMTITAVLLLGCVLLTLGAWAVLRGPFIGGSARGRHIAILPLQTIGASPGLKEFAASLGDTLQSDLSNGLIQTVSPGDAATLTGQDGTQRRRALNVGMMLGGSVRGDGGRLAVHLRLDDAAQHTTLWTQDLSGPAASQDSLQAQVGASTIAVLTCAATALRPKGGLSDPSVLALFLRACGIEQTDSLTDLRQIDMLLDTMRQVTAQAPGFAAGHAYLAIWIGYLRGRFPQTQQPALIAEADREAKRALAIDPAEPTAYGALELIQPVRAWGRREALLQKGLAADPASAHPNGLMGSLLLEVGRLGEARTFFLRAVAANPQSTDFSTSYQPMYAGTVSGDDADLTRYAALWPDMAVGIWPVQMISLMEEGHWSEASDLLLRRPPGVSQAVADCFGVLDKAGKSRSAKDVSAAATAFLAGTCSMEGLSDRAVALALLGDVDDAFRLAGQAAADPNSDSSFLFMPATIALRRDRRFMSLAAKFGLVAYWRNAASWPDFCAEGGLPYDCKAEAAKIVEKTSATH